MNYAIAVFDGKKIKGTVRFMENMESGKVVIDIDIEGLSKKTTHGFHVHEYGDMSDYCTSMCAHFNPYHKNHGGPESKDRHVGDLGNLVTDSQGKCKMRIIDSQIKLHGRKANILGRGLIIHADPDDLGLGEEADSLTTGHAGARIACAVIGHTKASARCIG
jgi:Cu-Zn family superoxide dismutase